MDEIWDRIEAWLAMYAPQLAVALNPPASEDEIAAVEQSLAIRLPDDVRASYLRHNGESNCCSGLFGVWYWLSLEEIQETYARWQEFVPRMKAELIASLRDEGNIISDDDDNAGTFVHNDWWDAAWVPLNETPGGDLYCLDFAPGPEGVAGQIIEVSYYYDGEPPVIARSFRAWLNDLAEGLVSGAFVFCEKEKRILRAEDVQIVRPTNLGGVKEFRKWQKALST